MGGEGLECALRTGKGEDRGAQILKVRQKSDFSRKLPRDSVAIHGSIQEEIFSRKPEKVDRSSEGYFTGR